MINKKEKEDLNDFWEYGIEYGFRKSKGKPYD